MKQKINETLAELIIGIFASGMVVQVLMAVGNKGFTVMSAGLWLGLVGASLVAVHMYRTIDRSLDMLPEDAEKYTKRSYSIRALTILAVSGITAYFKIECALGLLCGIFCLKFGAFLQPLTHKLLGKYKKK